MSEPEFVPAIQGFFTLDREKPHLIGTRCTACSTYFFPPEKVRCRNPGCGATTLESAELSRTGKVWSFTNAGYKPPEPFIAKEPYSPFAIAAVELEKEKLCVLGMVVDGTGPADLKAGMTMELVLDVLFERDGQKHLTWKWKPVSAS
jgi:uncharacterized OB-fold protein